MIPLSLKKCVCHKCGLRVFDVMALDYIHYIHITNIYVVTLKYKTYKRTPKRVYNFQFSAVIDRLSICIVYTAR